MDELIKWLTTNGLDFNINRNIGRLEIQHSITSIYITYNGVDGYKTIAENEFGESDYSTGLEVIEVIKHLVDILQ